jgi:FixJ family two-component response regulator
MQWDENDDSTTAPTVQWRTVVGERKRKDPAVGARLLVAIIDDDESVRESLPDLVRRLGFDARGFSSAEAFLASELGGATRCLILDITLSGMSGPELRRRLASQGEDIPTIFITAGGDKTLRARLLAEGAVECLFKPFSGTALLEALNAALPGRST